MSISNIGEGEGVDDAHKRTLLLPTSLNFSMSKHQTSFGVGKIFFKLSVSDINILSLFAAKIQATVNTIKSLQPDKAEEQK